MSTEHPTPPQNDAPSGEKPPGAVPSDTQPSQRLSRVVSVYTAVLVGAAVATVLILALLISIFTRKQEARVPFERVVEVDEDTIDPKVWGANWPRQYDSYKRTVDHERTRYGGSDAIPVQKLDEYPWLRTMWSGYAFSLDYREARGHAYMLWDQDHTERVAQRPQPGACLHCHASILPAYRYVGKGDVMEGFRQVNAMSWSEARNLKDDEGRPLVEHPVSCVDCHDPETMRLRITRPAFIEGIRAYKASQGVDDYNVNRDASHQEMRTFACAQCHVEYYFTKPDTQVVYPWRNGLLVEEIETYYDEMEFSDWTHGITGAPMLKAQHPEFELWNQGTHAAAGVSCADCHMPYRRVGAMKVSDHHVRSPLLDVAASCQTCHNVPEEELLRRAHTIQDRTHGLIERAAEALSDMIEAIAEAKEAGGTDEQLEPLQALHRKAQWRLDYVFSENSHGFHAPQESARILAESIDFSRRAVTLAYEVKAAPGGPPREVEREPIHGVTPDEEAPSMPSPDASEPD
ncbi:MAG: ammonia-forming cytochrome c nitrite reductase subunit c552 [Thermoguttaceae bacterium]